MTDEEYNKAMEAARKLVDLQREQVRQLCEQVGYGFVMSEAAKLWAEKDPMGAFTVGPCAGVVKSAIGGLGDKYGNVTLSNITSMYYDCPLVDVNITQRKDEEPRLEIRVFSGLMEDDGEGSFTPDLDEVQGWIMALKTAVARYRLDKAAGKP